MSRVDDIKARLREYQDTNPGWRIKLVRPYASSSTILQEMGSRPEYAFADFINNVEADLEYLLSRVEDPTTSSVGKTA